MQPILAYDYLLNGVVYPCVYGNLLNNETLDLQCWHSLAENSCGNDLTFDIENGKCLFYMSAGDTTAGWHDLLYASFIFLDVELEHALLRGDIIDALQVNLAQVLDVYGPALEATDTLGQKLFVQMRCFASQPGPSVECRWDAPEPNIFNVGIGNVGIAQHTILDLHMLFKLICPR